MRVINAKRMLVGLIAWALMLLATCWVVADGPHP